MQMTITCFEPGNKSPAQIVPFCGDMEGLEAERGSLDVIGINNRTGGRRSNPNRHKTPDTGRKKRGRESESDLNISCPLHPNGKHLLKDCHDFKNLKSAQQKKYGNPKRTDGYKKHGKRTEQELNVLVHAAVEKALDAHKRQKRKITFTTEDSPESENKPARKTGAKEKATVDSEPVDLTTDSVQAELSQFTEFTIDADNDLATILLDANEENECSSDKD